MWRPCIGCNCHKVPWNQGSDYCDTCIVQSGLQIGHREAARFVRARRVRGRSA